MGSWHAEGYGRLEVSADEESALVRFAERALERFDPYRDLEIQGDSLDRLAVRTRDRLAEERLRVRAAVAESLHRREVPDWASGMVEEREQKDPDVAALRTLLDFLEHAVRAGDVVRYSAD